MATPPNAAIPGNDPFAGGSYTPAGRPTGVGGSFNLPSAAGGQPGNFGTPAAAYARNDRGSNIRIPYARVVPLHSKDRLYVEDGALSGTGRSEASEYDGLEPGELAWILGKQFVTTPDPDVNYPSLVASSVDFSTFGHNIDGPGRGINELRAAWRANPPGLGMADGSMQTPGGFSGFGVDRMQRMAYTNWVEAFFKQRIARQRIDLTALRVVDDNNQNAFLDSEIAFYGALKARAAQLPPPAPRLNPPAREAGFLDGATVLCVPDIAYALQATPVQRGPASMIPEQPNRMQVQVPMMQGLYVMEQGPFLRSYGAESSSVEIALPNDSTGSRVRTWHNVAGGEPTETPKIATVDRHLGSDIAQRTLFCALKKHGVFNWVPDGICLSKLENGPDSGADAEYDARAGQLFNVGVQGPCITKTWCGDVRQHVMPGDKLFICVVGDVNYELATVGTPAVAAADLIARNAALTAGIRRRSMDNVNANAVGAGWNDRNYAVTGRGPAAAQAAENEIYEALAPNAYDGVIALQNAAIGPSATTRAFQALVTTLNQFGADTSGDEFVAQSLVTAADEAKKSYMDLVGDAARCEVGSIAFRDAAAQVRNGRTAVRRAEVRNIRLMRASSSFLANTSHFDHEEKVDKGGKYKSRCGLRIGFNRAGANAVANLVPHPARSQVIAATASGAAVGIDPGSGTPATDAVYQAAERAAGGARAANAAQLAATLYFTNVGDPADAAGDLNGANGFAGPNAADWELINPKVGMRRDDAFRVAAIAWINGAPPGARTYNYVGLPNLSKPALPEQSGNAEYILGAWCIGTVMDSAASRALGHNGVRSAPQTMAVNVNVNVEWWDANKLYQHYQDKDRGLYQSVDVATEPANVPVPAVAGPAQDAANAENVRRTRVRDETNASLTLKYGAAGDERGKLAPDGTTVFMRTVMAMRTQEKLENELAKNQGYRTAARPIRETAHTMLTRGIQDFEGGYKQPNVMGADTDAHGIVVHDRRAHGPGTDAAAYTNAAKLPMRTVNEVAPVDEPIDDISSNANPLGRVWSAAV